MSYAEIIAAPPRLSIEAQRAHALAEMQANLEREAAAIAARPFRFEDLNGRPEPEKWGPVYPALPSVEKWRKLNRARDLSDDEIRSYGAAVGAAIRALNTPSPRQGLNIKSRCASGQAGTFCPKKHRASQIAALHAGANADRRRPTDAEIVEAYEAAMIAKQERLAAETMREAA